MKALNDYINLDYPITIYRAPEGGYVAEIEDLPGCISEGETSDEALERVENARQAWIEVAYEDGQEIPLPRNDQEYSGKFIVRIPRYLHRRLAELSTREGVSLNQMVEVILSAGISTHSQNTEIMEIKSKLERIENQLSSQDQKISVAQPYYFDWQIQPPIKTIESIKHLTHKEVMAA
jgi:predicted RNase H-like HicB family nuclease